MTNLGFIDGREAKPRRMCTPCMLSHEPAAQIGKLIDCWSSELQRQGSGCAARRADIGLQNFFERGSRIATSGTRRS